MMMASVPTTRILGREPVLWLGVVSAGVQFMSAQWLDLTTGQQGAINAAVAGVLATVAAFGVSAERGVPVLVGAIQALVALGLAFGLALTPEAQSTLMALVTAAASLWVRDRVVPVTPSRASVGVSVVR